MRFTRKESYLSVSHHRIRVCLPRFRSLRPLRFIAMRLVSSALGIWKQNHILRLSLTDEPRVSSSLSPQLFSLSLLPRSRPRRPFTPQTLSPASFIRGVKIHLPFCWHREPTERLSSGQWSFSRWLVNRQNTRLDNCGDRTLVRLITLHYKCIKLESNYKRARDRASRRNLAKWLQVNASLSARNLKAMRDCRWSKANRKSENRSYTSLYLHVHTYMRGSSSRNAAVSELIRSDGEPARSSRSFVIIIALVNVSIIVKARQESHHRSDKPRCRFEHFPQFAIVNAKHIWCPRTSRSRPILARLKQLSQRAYYFANLPPVERNRLGELACLLLEFTLWQDPDLDTSTARTKSWKCV